VTATRSTPSRKLRARVRSATAEPHTTGHAISGAWAGGACRNDRATILSRSDPACSNYDSSSPQGKVDFNIDGGPRVRPGVVGAQTSGQRRASPPGPPVAHLPPHSESRETSAPDDAPRQSDRPQSPADWDASFPAASPVPSAPRTNTWEGSDGSPGSRPDAVPGALRSGACEETSSESILS